MREMKKKQEKTGYSLVSSGNNGGDLLAIRGRKYRKRIKVVFPLTAIEIEKTTCCISLL
jgi:hypothetical protein